MPMKRLFFALLAIMALSCSKFDDSEIWDKLNNHESRIAELEMLCKEMNAEIIKLQTLVTALESNDYIVTASPLVTGDGYTFVFKSGKSVVVYNGKDGTNGTNGITPQIGVKQDADGYYYWTVNGEWLIVDGNKVRASATDGTNGKNGTDGVTPKFKIEDGYWYVSYDNGVSWEKLGKAEGDSGLNGANGDSFFKSVDIKDGYVVFVLNDGLDTVIKIPLQKGEQLVVTLDEAGTLQSAISSEQRSTTSSLKIKGMVNNDDMIFVQHFITLLELDLSEATFSGTTEEDIFLLNPYREEMHNRTLCKVWLPQLQGDAKACYSHCINLEHVIVPAQDTYSWSNSYTYFSDSVNIDMAFCPFLKILEYSEGTVDIPSDAIMTYRKSSTTKHLTNQKSKYSVVILPASTQTVSSIFLRYDRYFHSSDPDEFDIYDYTVTCKAITPPTVNNKYTGDTFRLKNCVLYVPSESVEAYKADAFWGMFDVLAIE